MTLHVEIYTKEILFLLVHLILKCTSYGWEKCTIMLSRMGMMSIIISFSFFARKITTMNNTITISDVHGSQTKTNIDAMNEINHI
jgi:hypothetical protein